jgi:hypothetical protein
MRLFFRANEAAPRRRGWRSARWKTGGGEPERLRAQWRQRKRKGICGQRSVKLMWRILAVCRSKANE